MTDHADSSRFDASAASLCVNSRDRSIEQPSKGDQVLREAVNEVNVTADRQHVLRLQRVNGVGLLASSLCHELNNALSPILNYAKLGLRSDDPDFRRQALTRILEAAQTASTMTSGVLGLARADRPEPEPTDLATLVEQVIGLTRKDLSRHRIELTVQWDDRPWACVHAAQIQQIVLNFLINARQAMQGQTEGRLLVLVQADQHEAKIVVADNGPGIPDADLARIFDPYFSTKSSDASGLGGTGLGLAICREIIQAHRGRIRAESHPGHGARFTLILPRCVPPNQVDTLPSQGAAVA